jgi:hypothetical protein
MGRGSEGVLSARYSVGALGSEYDLNPTLNLTFNQNEKKTSHTPTLKPNPEPNPHLALSLILNLNSKPLPKFKPQA